MELNKKQKNKVQIFNFKKKKRKKPEDLILQMFSIFGTNLNTAIKEYYKSQIK